MAIKQGASPSSFIDNGIKMVFLSIESHFIMVIVVFAATLRVLYHIKESYI